MAQAIERIVDVRDHMFFRESGSSRGFQEWSHLHCESAPRRRRSGPDDLTAPASEHGDDDVRAQEVGTLVPPRAIDDAPVSAGLLRSAEDAALAAIDP